ncbi:MAG: VWA domain-containing protein [Burkholderiales bacterium]|nr:VWA domain-containing protein [Burkholderiales bacterium]
MSAFTIETWWPAILLPVGMLFTLWVARHTETALSPGRRPWVAGLRIAGIAAAVAALMQPTWLARTDAISVVYALDVSRSIDPAFIDAAIRWIDRTEARGPTHDARFIAFAASARLTADAEAIRALPVRGAGGGSASALDQDATDLEAALDAARDAFAPHRVKRLVLISDGVATTGDAWRGVERLRREGVRIFTSPALVRSGTDAWIAGIDTPRDWRRDEPGLVKVRVEAQARTRARVMLARDGQPLGQKSLTLEPGVNVVAFTVKIAATGATALEASVTAEGDQAHDNDRYTQSVSMRGRPRIWYVEGDNASGSPLRDALVREGIDVVSGSVASLPAKSTGYESYDAVILSDVAAKDADAERMHALASWVRDDGGGLLFVAGAATYGESGWRESAVEKVLPVTFEAQEKRRELALVIALDRSYSMKGRKLDLAKAATLGALDLLDENHRFGVITFDSQPEMTVPLAPVRSKRRAEDQISRFTASGQTNIYPALQSAYRLLVDNPSKSKHVILLSDGDTQPADFQRLVKRMAEANITVSTVAIGAEADTALMESIAKWGKGRHYYTVTPDLVPKIFIEETKRLVNESLVEEPVRAVPRRKAETIRGVDFEHAPPLRGYASTKLKDGAELTLSTETGAPLLARWQYGLGRAAVFTSDAKNRWAADWLGWPGYGKFWSQLVRETMRRDAGEDVNFEATRDGANAVIRLTALDAAGGFRNDLRPRVKVTLPDGKTRAIELSQAGPGRYEARMPMEAMGRAPWRFELAEGGGVGKALVARAGVQALHRPYPDELRLKPADQALLQAMAEQTGGKFAPEPADVFASLGDHATRPRALWPWFAALALLCYLLDLAVRRVPRLAPRGTAR